MTDMIRFLVGVVLCAMAVVGGAEPSDERPFEQVMVDIQGASPERALELIEIELGSTDDPSRVSALQTAAATALLQLSEFDSARDRLAAATAAAEAAGDPSLLVSTRLIRGSLAFHAGNSEDALGAYQEALSLAVKSGLPDGELRALSNIGNVMRQMGDLEGAAEYYQRAHDVGVRLDSPIGRAGTAINLGLVLSELDDLDGALQWYRVAERDFTSLGNPLGLSMAAHNIGVVLSERDPTDPEAIRAFVQALEVRESINDARGLVATLGALASVEVETGDIAAAREHVDRALAVSEAIGGTEETPHVYWTLAEVEESEGDLQGAIDALRIHARLADEQRTEAMQARVAEMESRFGAEASRRELEVQQIALDRQRVERNLFATLAAMFVVVAVAAGAAWRIKVRAADRLERMASTDLLTGIPNRRALREHLHREVARSRRSGRPLSLGLVDVDGFKQFNDRHGHACGDEVLREVARCLHSSVRAQDIMGRWGGEEFLLILPDTGPEGGLVVAETVRSIIETTPFLYEGFGHNLTISVGLAHLGEGDDSDDLLRAADDAMYRAKERGRNRVEAAE
jgi:diguanylate cyclase (GGDEF)-like protein